MAVTELHPVCKVCPYVEITAQDFALMIERMSIDKRRVLYGCDVTLASSNTALHISPGWILLYGRLIRVLEGTIDVAPIATSLGTITRYLIVEVNPYNTSQMAKIFVSNKAPDTQNEINANQREDGYGQMALCTFRQSAATLSNLSNKVTKKDESDIVESLISGGGATTYDSGTVRPWGNVNSQNFLDIKLHKAGNSVTASILCQLQIPTNYLNKWTQIGEIAIPERYNPSNKRTAVAQSVTNGFINEGKVTLWMIQDKKLYINTNIANYTERIVSFGYTI